jgi:adenosylcobinamide-GDP ribazoletransferase
MIKGLRDLLSAFQFMTRLPLPSVLSEPEQLSRAAKFFPVVGLVIGLGAAALNRALSGHVSRSVIALMVLTYMVLITGALHEDGLADVADGFGGGWTKGRILLIMHDSRVGAFGVIALILSLLARYILLSELAVVRFSSYVIVAHVLCRWTTLPLGMLLRPARQDGPGTQLAQRTSVLSLIFATGVTLVVCYLLLRKQMWLPTIVTVALTLLTAAYYRSQIGGVTGDCFGATNQLTEIAIYFCGLVAA